jgi:hypothetical protein
MTPETRKPDTQLDVADHPLIWRWLKETSRSDPEGFLRLSRGNVQALTRLLGKAGWRIADHPDWTHGWTVVEEGLTWAVLSGPHSTCYRLRVPGEAEAYRQDPRVAVGGVAFLQRLLTRLMG